MNGGGGRRSLKRKGTRKVARSKTVLVTPRKGDQVTLPPNLAEDGGAPGRGGVPRSTPNRHAAKARRLSRGTGDAQLPSSVSDLLLPPEMSICLRVNDPTGQHNTGRHLDPFSDNPEVRRLASGGKSGRRPATSRPADRGWDDTRLNTREKCVQATISKDVEYDPQYQRLRRRVAAQANNALRESRES